MDEDEKFREDYEKGRDAVIGEKGGVEGGSILD